MTFTREKINEKYIWIIDIWTYKIRVWICKILNREVELIWYWEKRQDIKDVSLHEIINLENVCHSIKQAINKAEIDAKRKVNDFFINIPTSNIFFQWTNINYARENNDVINEGELFEIIKNIEKKAFEINYKKIKHKSGFNKEDLKLIISNISNIKLDNELSKKILWKNPKEININIFNIFITEKNYEIKKYISNNINKNIERIIPSEYALLWLFSERKDIIIIDIWNSHTSIIVKKDNNILWVQKLDFWINDLIKNIRDNYNLTRIEIINKINEDIFEREKAEFLDLFTDILTITLEDILKWEICPNDFCMLWWWANKFIRDWMTNLNLNKNNLKIAKKINFICPKIDFIDENLTENIEWLDNTKSNINIFALIKSSLEFIKKDKSLIERIIKKIIKDIN